MNSCQNNYILEYHQKINDGTIIAGIWVKLVYEYIVKGLENKSFFYDQKKAHKAVKFIENFCHHSKGALAPQRVKLELWQKAMLSVIFGIVDEGGCRQFREVLVVVGRKCGKSLLASGIMEYMSYADGEYGADVYCLAPKLDQTDIVFNDFWQSVQAEPDLLDISSKRKTDIYIERTNTSIKKIAFSAKKSDGFNPHLTVCDEIASWQGDGGIKQYEVMSSALGARTQPLIVSITTANYIDGGIYDDLYARATRVLKGNSKETRLIAFLYQIDELEKWDDINELMKSLPNLGVSVSVNFMLEEIAKASQSLSNKREFMCKYCNIKQNSSLAWLDSSVIAASKGEKMLLEDYKGSYCITGLDLSQTTDLTAAICLIQKKGKINVFAKFWLPSSKLQEATERDGLPYELYIQKGWLALSGENFIDYKDCYEWFTDLVQQYELYPLMVGYDRYSAQYLINDLTNYGFRTDDVYQGDNLWPVLQEMEGLFKDGVINIGDNDLLAIHLLNAAVKMSVERGRGKLVKINPTAHIDGAAALADAFCVRQKWWNEMGSQLINEE